MSNIYATEPATSGRVIFETTHGPLEIQLWCRECPTTTKFFIQLCMDGFYDNMIFHRIIEGFLIQTGALRQPSGPSTEQKATERYRTQAKADEALERRRYELHSRIRFNHRGQVAMALGVEDDKDTFDLQPQFFITLDETSSLDGKHVLFGTISGPTIFNALRIGSNTEVDESSLQPVDLEHAPRIKSVKILDNPIHTDLTPISSVPWQTIDVKEKPKTKKKKRKGKLDKNVLSFGNEMEDGSSSIGTGMQQSGGRSVRKNKTPTDRMEVEPKTASKGDKPFSSGDKEAEKKRSQNDGSARVAFGGPAPGSVTFGSSKFKDDAISAKKHAETSVAKLKGPEEPKPVTSIESQSRKPKESRQKSAVSLVESRKSKYMKGTKSKRQREDDTMAKLMAFRNKVQTTAAARKATADQKEVENSLASRMARRAQAEMKTNNDDDQQVTYHGQVLESDDDAVEGNQDWLNTTFKCRKHMDQKARESSKIMGGDGRAASDYMVVDDKGQGGDRHGEHEHPHKRRRHHHHHHHHRDRHDGEPRRHRHHHHKGSHNS